MNVSKLSVLLPPRPPSRVDLLTVVLALGILATDSPLSQNPDSGIAWSVAVATFVLVVLIAGPGARTSLGRSVAQWFNDIGYVGRLLVVGCAMAVVAIASSAFPMPEQVINGLFIGILSSIIATVSVNYLHAKTVGRSNPA